MLVVRVPASRCLFHPASRALVALSNWLSQTASCDSCTTSGLALRCSPHSHKGRPRDYLYMELHVYMCRGRATRDESTMQALHNVSSSADLRQERRASAVQATAARLPLEASSLLLNPPSDHTGPARAAGFSTAGPSPFHLIEVSNGIIIIK